MKSTTRSRDELLSSTTRSRKESDDTQASLSQTEESDVAWGAESIGAEIDRTPDQVYYLYRIGALKGAVKKLGHRTMVGSRRRLRALALAPPDTS